MPFSLTQLRASSAYSEAAGTLGDEANPFQTVANIASLKIVEAIAFLDEYRTESGAGPEPDALPVKQAARPKRKGRNGCREAATL